MEKSDEGKSATFQRGLPLKDVTIDGGLTTMTGEDKYPPRHFEGTKRNESQKREHIIID